MKNCNNCRHINVTEEDQIDKTESHICMIHGIRVLHRSNRPDIEHNYIYPCEKCNEEDFEERY